MTTWFFVAILRDVKDAVPYGYSYVGSDIIRPRTTNGRPYTFFEKIIHVRAGTETRPYEYSKKRLKALYLYMVLKNLNNLI